MHWTPLALIPVFVSTFALITLFNARQKIEQYGNSISYYFIAVIIWNFGDALELLSISGDMKLFWDKFQMLGATLTPFFFLIFIFKYTHTDKFVHRSHIALLLIIPIVTLFLSITNDFHHLIWQDISFKSFGAINFLEQTTGPALKVFVVYSGIVGFVSILLLGLMTTRSEGYYLLQTYLFFFAATLPIVMGTLEVLKLMRIQYFPLTSTAAAISGIIVVQSLSAYQKRDLLRISKGKILDHSSSAILVVDERNHIQYISSAASILLGRNDKYYINNPIDNLYAAFPEIRSVILGISQDNIVSKGDHIFKIEINPINDWMEYIIGRIIRFQEITDLHKQNQNLSLLLESSQALSTGLDLKNILFTLAKDLLKISEFNYIVISEWDSVENKIFALLEYGLSYPQLKGGVHYSIADYPKTEALYKNKDSFIVQWSDDDPETDWMLEMGWYSLILLPLVIDGVSEGLIEIGRSSKTNLFTQDDLEVARQFTTSQQRDRFFTPVTSTPKDNFLAYSSGLWEVLHFDTCAISAFDHQSNEVFTIFDDARMYWDIGSGPSYQFDKWPNFKTTLMDNNARIFKRGDADISLPDKLDLDRWNAQTIVLFPFQRRGKPTGLIELYKVDEKVDVSEENLRLWQDISSKAAIAIENARLHLLTKKRLEEQSALLKVGNAISSTLIMSKVLTEISKQMALAIDATSAYIVKHDVKTFTSTVTAEYFSDHASPKEMLSDLGVTFEEDRAWVEEIVNSRKYDVSHVDNESLSEEERLHLIEFDAKSVLYIPLLFQGHLVGYAELWESRHKRIFTEDEIQFCTAIAQQAGIAIKNAENYLQAQNEIIEHQKTQQSLKKSEAYYRSLFENAHDAILIFDPKTEQVLDVNQRACEIYGFTRAEFIGMDLKNISGDENAAKQQIDQTIKTGKQRNFETIQLKKDGTKMYLDVNASIIDFQGNPAVLSINRDVTRRKEIEEKLIKDAMYDDLTGLINRKVFMERLTLAIARNNREKEFMFAVLFLDMDNFKTINDSLGHNIGDKFLYSIGQRIKNTLRKNDTAARFGGDEFAILVESQRSVEGVVQVCRRILDLTKKPVKIREYVLESSASIGVIVSNDLYLKGEEIIRDADIAMYKAKELGGNQFELFDEPMRRQLIQHVQFENDLKYALKNNEFRLHYQPIISLVDNSITHLEALLRWQPKNGGLIYPDKFIPLAEKSGLIIDLGDWVIEAVIKQIKEWQARLQKPLPFGFTINLSGQQLNIPNFDERVNQIFHHASMNFDLINFEITESAIIQNFNNSSNNLNWFKAQGLNLFLDDFGTGYSSLAYLQKLPLKGIKIDKSFIANISNEKGLNFVGAMINMGKGLGLKIVAEGIETREQFDLLRKLGCDYGQGWLFHKAASPEVIFEYLAQGDKALSPQNIAYLKLNFNSDL